MKKERKKLEFRGIWFLIFIFVIYILLLLHDKRNTIIACKKSFNLFLHLTPIFILIILLTAVLNRFLKPKQVMRHLGKDSGLKGWTIALLGGVLSHGPMYMWYLLLDDLKKQGLRDGLITSFLYARAVKLPLLPLMIEYFGLRFSLFLSFYIVLGAFIQGFIIEKLLSIKGRFPQDQHLNNHEQAN